MTQRIAWNDEKIKAGIMEVAEHVGEGRMPTYVEVEEYYGNRKLASQIASKGGFAEWATKVGLPLKANRYNFGVAFEKYTQGLLQGRGYEVYHTSTCCAYDLLINKKVKVDVKASRLVDMTGHVGYTFHVADKLPKCDVYIAYCVDDDDNIVKTYIIPAHRLTGMTQLCLGEHRSKYDVYLDRWDIIDKINEMLTGLEVS